MREASDLSTSPIWSRRCSNRASTTTLPASSFEKIEDIVDGRPVVFSADSSITWMWLRCTDVRSVAPKSSAVPMTPLSGVSDSRG